MNARSRHRPVDIEIGAGGQVVDDQEPAIVLDTDHQLLQLQPDQATIAQMVSY